MFETYHSAPPLPSTIIHLHLHADDITQLPPPCRFAQRQSLVASTMAACSPFPLVGLPTDDRPPRGSSSVASPGQARLQFFDLALIPIVGICPQINHMKLDKHTWRLLLSPSVRIARSELVLYFLLFSLVLQLT
jgi:hypothetical protein